MAVHSQYSANIIHGKIHPQNNHDRIIIMVERGEGGEFRKP